MIAGVEFHGAAVQPMMNRSAVEQEIHTTHMSSPRISFLGPVGRRQRDWIEIELGGREGPARVFFPSYYLNVWEMAGR